MNCESPTECHTGAAHPGCTGTAANSRPGTSRGNPTRDHGLRVAAPTRPHPTSWHSLPFASAVCLWPEAAAVPEEEAGSSPGLTRGTSWPPDSAQWEGGRNSRGYKRRCGRACYCSAVVPVDGREVSSAAVPGVHDPSAPRCSPGCRWLLTWTQGHSLTPCPQML